MASSVNVYNLILDFSMLQNILFKHTQLIIRFCRYVKGHPGYGIGFHKSNRSYVSGWSNTRRQSEFSLNPRCRGQWKFSLNPRCWHSEINRKLGLTICVRAMLKCVSYIIKNTVFKPRSSNTICPFQTALVETTNSWSATIHEFSHIKIQGWVWRNINFRKGCLWQCL